MRNSALLLLTGLFGLSSVSAVQADQITPYQSNSGIVATQDLNDDEDDDDDGGAILFGNGLGDAGPGLLAVLGVAAAAAAGGGGGGGGGGEAPQTVVVRKGSQ